MSARVIVTTEDGTEVWRMDSVAAWQVSGLQCPGNVSGSTLAAGIRRAVQDAEVIEAGGDPERLSEKAMRIASITDPALRAAAIARELGPITRERPKPRPDHCPNCGDGGITAHTGSYCEKCGEVL